MLFTENFSKSPTTEIKFSRIKMKIQFTFVNFLQNAVQFILYPFS